MGLGQGPGRVNLPGVQEGTGMKIRAAFSRCGGRADEPEADPQDTAGFDAAWYLRAYPDVAASGLDPLRHYLQSGWREGRSPAAGFDGLFYRMTVSAPLAPEMCPLAHWNRTGSAANAPRSRVEALAGMPFRPDAAQVVASHPGLAALFDADHYLTRYPDALHSGPDPLAHYLTHGWQEGRNPSVGFDTAFYRERFMSGDAAVICPLLHYHLYGRAAALPPTRREAMERSRALAAGQGDPALDLLSGLSGEVRAALLAPFFSPDHYLAAYPDVARSGSDPYWHYISNGWREERIPGPLFDPAIYAAPADTDLPPLLHYAVIGRMAGQSGSRHETRLAQERAAETLADERLADLLLQLGCPLDLTDRWRLGEVILPMFSAADCRRRHGLGPAPSDAEVFLRYLALDLPAGIPPGLLFRADHYLIEVARLGLPPLHPQEHAFHHWLRHGYAAGASPVPAFAASDYLALNGDLTSYPGPLWGHFIRHGAAEGRRFSPMAVVAPGRQVVISADAAPRPLAFLERLSRAPDFRAMQDFHRSGRLAQTIADAARHEPELGELGPPGQISAMIPPWHDESWAEYEQALDLLPEGRIDAVVLMPFCKLGGADFVAGVLAATLAEAGRKVLVLRTDAPDWARPDWFPQDCVSLDLSRHLGKAHQPQRMLYELLVRLRPADVYNVNSRLAFQTFERFGERLALMMRLNAYYFCADRTPDGAETGYPVWYFSNILGHLSSALIDNAALAGQLIRRFGLSGNWRDKVRVVYTPAMTPPPSAPLADIQIESAPQRPRKRILWAGRLDAQKRFDLVQEIARLLPGVDFDCWGKAVLDAPPDLSRLPANLRLHGAFDSYGNLPLAASDGWLYTSGWDGIPTILIELAAHGLPIVASAVGGVPELIDETTGWPLAAEATAADYAAAITAMLADPEERRKRGEALQDRVRRQHSRAFYAAALADAAKGS